MHLRRAQISPERLMRLNLMRFACTTSGAWVLTEIKSVHCTNLKRAQALYICRSLRRICLRMCLAVSLALVRPRRKCALVASLIWLHRQQHQRQPQQPHRQRRRRRRQ